MKANEQQKISGEYNVFVLAKDLKYYRIAIFSPLLKSIFRATLRNKRSRYNSVVERLVYSKGIRQMKHYVETGNPSLLSSLTSSGVVLEHNYARNIIPTTGRNVLARRLAGDTTYSGEVDYGAVGDGVTAFTNASTTLNNEIYRKQADSQAYDDNIAYIDWFIASGDTADDTFEEFGAFVDGTASADTGQAFSLLITGGWVKSGSMFISGKYTFV